jgi:hypothetical protein
MVQAGHELDFALEARGQFLPSRQIREKNFHGFDTVRDNVPHAPDAAHSAAPQFVKDLVIADTLAGFFAHQKHSLFRLTELGMAA